MSDPAEQRRPDRRAILPAILVAAVIIVPAAIWAAGSGGGGDDGLRIEQSVSALNGRPEIVVAVPREHNTMAETGNKANVVLVCFDASGNELFTANQGWPFVEEAGYDRPHTHQSVSDAQLKALAKCTVRGTKHNFTGTLRRG